MREMEEVSGESWEFLIDLEFLSSLRVMTKLSISAKSICVGGRGIVNNR